MPKQGGPARQPVVPGPTPPTTPNRPNGSTPPEPRRSSVLGYLAEVEPLMEPTGGYPIIVPRSVSPATPATPPPGRQAPPSALDGPPPERPRRRQWLIVVVLIFIIVVLAGMLLAVQHRQSTGHVRLPLPSGIAVQPDSALPAGAPATTVSASTASGSPEPSSGDSASGSPSAQASGSPDPSASAAPSTLAGAPTLLQARYETVGNTGLLGLTGYQGRVTIENPGDRPANGWVLTIVLPDGETVASASGAGFLQKGGTVTFTPTDSTAEVPPAGSVTFTFNVNGLLGGAPTACAVNDHPCD